MRGTASCLLATFFLISLTVNEACPQAAGPREPELRIASPFAASLWQIDLDRDGKTLVMSASNETATVFDLQTTPPTREHTFRVPARDRQQTRGMGVAIRHDGTLIALAVPPLVAENGLQKLGTAAIYVFNRMNKTIVSTGSSDVNGLPIPTRAPKLKFSPDGEYLVATLSFGCGVRVWETKTWTLVGRDDRDFAPASALDTPYCGTEEQAPEGKDTLSVYSGFDVLFREGDPGQLWFSVSARSGVRNYRRLNSPVDGSIIDRTALRRTEDIHPTAGSLARDGITQPRTLALDSKGKRLAVGNNGSLRVALLDAGTLEPVAPGILEIPEEDIVAGFRHRREEHILPQVAWLGSGASERLYAGGFLSTERLAGAARQRIADLEAKTRADLQDAANNLVRWDPAHPETAPQFISFGSNSIMALRPLPGGRDFAAAALDTFGVIANANEAPAASYAGSTQALDFRRGTLAVGRDGSSIRATTYSWPKPLVVSIELRDSAGFIALKTVSRETEEGRALLADERYRSASTPPEIVGERQSWRQSFGAPLPRFFGKELNPEGVLFRPNARDRNDWSRIVAVSADRKKVLWGSSNALRLVEEGPDFAEVTCFMRTKSETLLVAFARAVSTGQPAPEDQLAVIAQSDGMIRWFEIRKGANGACHFVPRLSFYAEIGESGRLAWVAFKPNGQFYNEPLRDRFLGWQLTDDEGQVRFNVLNDTARKFYNLDVQNALDQDRPAQTDTGPIKRELEGLPYRIQLLDDTVVPLRVASPVTLPIKVTGVDVARTPMEVKLSIAEKPVAAAAATSRESMPATSLRPMRFERDGEYWVKFDLPREAQTKKGKFGITFDYENARPSNLVRTRQKQPFNKFEWAGDELPPNPKRTLAVIAGFSGYNDFPYLKYAHKDAIDVAKVLLTDFKNEWNREAGTGRRDSWRLKIHLFLSYGQEQSAETAILLDSLRTEAEAITALTGSDGDPLEITQAIVSSPSDRQPQRTAENFRTGILTQLDDFKRMTLNSDLRDAIIFYFSGHGLSEARGREGPSVNATVKDYLLTPATPQVERTPDPAHAILSSDIVARLEDARAEKIIIIDACRNLIAGSDKDDQNIYFLTSYEKLKLASVFLSADLDQASKIVSYSQLKTKPPALYGSMAIPRSVQGNSLFTHIVLQGLMCKDNARAGTINAKALGDFIYDYMEEGTFQRQELEMLLGGRPSAQVSPNPQLFSLAGGEPRIKPWFRSVGPSALQCIWQNK
jgi:hypothetical protein